MKKCNDEAEVANIGGAVAATKPDFSLIDENFLKSRIYTIRGVKGGRSYSPYAFTEQGVYMLMTVLKGERAVAQSKALIRLFKQMKDYIVAENQQLLGNDGIAEIALQTAQNSRIIADHSINIKELSGEVHDMRENLGKVNLDLQGCGVKISLCKWLFPKWKQRLLIRNLGLLILWLRGKIEHSCVFHAAKLT